MQRWIVFLPISAMILPSSAQPPADEIIYAVKPNPQLAAICAAEDGLEQVWASEPAHNQADIKFQYEGLKAQADAAAAARAADVEVPPELQSLPPVPLTFKEYRDAVLAQRCVVARDGLRETFETAMPFFGYSFFECDAEWDEDCRSKKLIRAPADAQICNVSYKIVKDRGKNTGVRVTPGGFIADQPNRAARFTEYQLEYWAHGSGAIFNQEGARIRAENFVVTIIPRDWPDAARRKLKCAMPGRPPVPQPTPTPTTQPGPIRPPTFREDYADNGRSYFFYLGNTNAVPIRVEYVVERKDTGDNRWKQAAYGVQEIAPGTTYFSGGYHGWYAVAWRTRYATLQ